MLPLVLGVALARPYGAGRYGSCIYGSNGCAISLSTDSGVGISLNPSGGDVVSIAKDNVNVITANYSGYTLSVESNTPSTNNLVGDYSTIIPVSGTPSSPTTLSSNSWGWRVDNEASFGAGPTSAVTNAPSSSLTFAAVPTNGSSVQVYSSNSATPPVTGDTIEVWYGIRVSPSKVAGDYDQTVLYTAVAQP